ncbi:TetR family transcriptional regulator [Murinocardiopsis flavida]|uniref:TetR family transcriptional regulator n=1 Tax=Murinocardiopsis flavida TaxID=645275 RepID=A0A2P8CWS0_9ACTN|nr:TetR family transcriptional regulator [Murinocardiopsis flavida]
MKARHRRAIVDAAAALMGEFESAHFTVDQLAERADVSRRTVFNHFGSLDDVILEVLSGMLETIVDGIDADLAAAPAAEVAAAPATGHASAAADRTSATPMFDRVSAALRGTDLVAPITRLRRMLGEHSGTPTPGEAVLFERAFTDLSARLAAAVRRHHPDADDFTVELMCGALVSGGLVVVRHWEETTGGVDTAESRRVWDDLLQRMISAARSGYGATSSTGMNCASSSTGTN